MSSIVGLRSRRLVLATVAIFVVAGGIAYAAIPDAGGVFHACVMKNGSVRIIDPDTDQCKQNESAITFNQQGQTGNPGPQGPPGANGTNGTNGTDGTDGTDGQPGVSPTVTQLAVNDPNCPAGGAAITDAAQHTSYVCSGTPFSGTFTSPNGQYSISVTDTGITIKEHLGPVITLTGSDLKLSSTDTAEIQTGGDFNVRAGADALVQSGSNLTLKSGGDATLQGGADLTVNGGSSVTVKTDGTATVSGTGLLALTGGFMTLNGASMCFPAARVGDGVTAGTISSGSNTVCIGG
jgi:hypothetical protein